MPFLIYFQAKHHPDRKMQKIYNCYLLFLINIKKGKTTITGGVEKPFSKVDKKNISSEISLGLERGDEDSSLSITGTKRGKSKNIGIRFGSLLRPV